MIGIIFGTFLTFVISAGLGGIPFIVILILLEAKGVMDYILAFSAIFAAVIELFLFFWLKIFCGEEDFSYKDVFTFIKNIFKKNDKNQNKEKSKIVSQEKKLDVLRIVMILVLIGIAVFISFYKTHGLIVNLIFDNVIIRIIWALFIPVAICDLILGIKDGAIESFGDFFSEIMTSFVLPLLLGFLISTSFIFVTTFVAGDVFENNVKPLFIYDNQEFDDIRNSENFKGKNEYLLSEFLETLTELKKDNDINSNAGFESIRYLVISSSDIEDYGYRVINKIYKDDYIYMQISDLKCLERSFYKLDLINSTFNEILEEEYLSINN